jgi:hypothetical protein
MMYGEHRFLKPCDLLMDAYRCVCKIHAATKLLFRPEWSRLHGLPRGMSCTNLDGAQYGSDDGTFQQVMSEYTQHSHLDHYYQKSTEEWLVKMEQSITLHSLYLYFKLKVAQRQDWDEEGFWGKHPEMRKVIEEQNM